MILDTDDALIAAFVTTYTARLMLPTENLWITTNRSNYNEWVGRRVGGSIGGAYVYPPRSRKASHPDQSQAHRYIAHEVARNCDL